jgi:hypothetical protein
MGESAGGLKGAKDVAEPSLKSTGKRFVWFDPRDDVLHLEVKVDTQIARRVVLARPEMVRTADEDDLFS